MHIGKYNDLTISRKTENGFYLEDDGHNEVLLPNKYCTEEMQIGDNIQVFVYKDSLSRLVATTQTPLLTLGEFGYLKVKSKSDFGAFLDMGLEKDLLVPLREQRHDLKIGRSYLVYLYIDDETDRLVGSTYTKKHLNQDIHNLKENQKVNILIGDETDLGWKVIINGAYEGLLYRNEVFRKLVPGEKTEAYIKRLRPDNKVDVTLQHSGFKHIRSMKDVLLDKLEANQGFLSLTDKSTPEEIMETLQMSKKAFKKTVGQLYKDKIITIDSNGIRILRD